MPYFDWLEILCVQPCIDKVSVPVQSEDSDVVATRLQLSEDGTALEAEVNGERLKANLSVHTHADEQVSPALCIFRCPEE